MIRLAEDESHGLHAIAKALHHHRRDLRRTADPLPVARACRVIAASRIPQTAIVVNQKLPPVGVSQVWEICFPRAGERYVRTCMLDILGLRRSHTLQLHVNRVGRVKH